MMNLTLVGLSEDGSALILRDEEQRRFTLAIDERLRSATRSGSVAHQEPVDAPIGAKEIQSRMRAGATPEEVADSAGWSVDRVMAFAAPVFQERSWIAEKAQACPVGRGDDDPNLGELVLRRLGERGIDESTTRWDAWLRGDGDWMVLLAYPAGQGDRVATWSFDPRAKVLVSLDDEAHWFTENRVTKNQGPHLVQATASPGGQPKPARPAASRNHPAGRAARGPNTGAKAVSPTPPPDVLPTDPAEAEIGELHTKEEPPTWDEVLFGGPPADSGQ